MPASRKQSRVKKSVKKYSLLIDDNKKLQYFKSRLPHRVSSITVRNADVKPGDCVIMDIVGDESGTSTSDDVCIAEVQEIRSTSRESTELFVLIRWFYTGPMLHLLPASKSLIKNLAGFNFAPRELILSDHAQVFSSAQLSKKVHIRNFNESSAEQPVINADEWWYRYFWATKQGEITMQNRIEAPNLACGLAKLCIKKHYAPHAEYQHYCARDSCRTWYHRECLIRAGLELDPEPGEDRLKLVLQGTPGFEWVGVDEEDSKFFEHIKICLQFIQGIVWCAQHSVLRGREYGVVGTYHQIKRARMLLYEARKDDLWPSEDEIKEFVRWAVPTEPIYQCKKCKLAI